MKVFISWSKPLSNQIAINLADWLKVIDRNVEPFVSSEGIEAGEIWLTRLMTELNETSIAILCLTPENFLAPWISFEAGAISKSLGVKSNVIPILFGLKNSDLPRNNPFVNFQGFTYNKTNMMKIIKTLNKNSKNPRSDDEIKRAFNFSWSGFDTNLTNHIEEAHKQYEKLIQNSALNQNTSPAQKYYDFLRLSLPSVTNAIETHFPFEDVDKKRATIQKIVKEFVKSTAKELLNKDYPDLLYEESRNLDEYSFLCKFCGDDVEVVEGGCKNCGIDCQVWIDKPKKGKEKADNNG